VAFENVGQHQLFDCVGCRGSVHVRSLIIIGRFGGNEEDVDMIYEVAFD